MAGHDDGVAALAAELDLLYPDSLLALRARLAKRRAMLNGSARLRRNQTVREDCTALLDAIDDALRRRRYALGPLGTVHRRRFGITLGEMLRAKGQLQALTGEDPAVGGGGTGYHQ